MQPNSSRERNKLSTTHNIEVSTMMNEGEDPEGGGMVIFWNESDQVRRME